MMTYTFQTAPELAKFLNDHAIAVANISSIYYDNANGRHVLVADVAVFDGRYSAPDGTYVTGSAITPIRPAYGGSRATGFVLQAGGPLPTGLVLNATTGIISGTPTQVKVRTKYTIRATNVIGTADIEVYITTVAP